MNTIFNPINYNEKQIDVWNDIWNLAFLLISNIILPSKEMAIALKSLNKYPFEFISTPNIDLSRIFSCVHGFSKHLGHLIEAEEDKSYRQNIIEKYKKLLSLEHFRNINFETRELLLSALWFISDAFDSVPHIITSLLSIYLQSLLNFPSILKLLHILYYIFL